MSNLAKNVQSWTFSMGRPLCPQISKLSICQRLSKNCECVLKLPKMAKKCQSLSRIVKSGKKKCQKLIDVAKVIQNCQRLAKKMSVLDFFIAPRRVIFRPLPPGSLTAPRVVTRMKKVPQFVKKGFQHESKNLQSQNANDVIEFTLTRSNSFFKWSLPNYP